MNCYTKYKKKHVNPRGLSKGNDFFHFIRYHSDSEGVAITQKATKRWRISENLSYLEISRSIKNVKESSKLVSQDRETVMGPHYIRFHVIAVSVGFFFI